MSHLLLILVIPVLAAVIAAAHVQYPQKTSSLLYPVQNKRIQTQEKIITDCMTVWSEEGHLYYKSRTNDPTVCGIYITAKPEQTVHVYFDYVDVPCNTGGLIAFVDGWELNGQLFPNEQDHPKSIYDRFFEICGSKKPKQIFKSSQNAALIQYRVPRRGNGFSFYVTFVNNPTPNDVQWDNSGSRVTNSGLEIKESRLAKNKLTDFVLLGMYAEKACNILMEGLTDVYTLRNYGKPVNCSLTTLYPAQVKILALGVGLGHEQKRTAAEQETGTIHKCDKRGLPDFVQVGGGDSLGQLSVVDSICGTNSEPESSTETIMCGVTTVRLVSSGQFHNAVTVAVTPPDVKATPTLVCEQ